MEVTGVTPAAHQERSKMAGEYHRANALLTSALRTFICAWANWSGSLQLVFHAFMLVCVSVCVCVCVCVSVCVCVFSQRNKAALRELTVGQKVICKHKNGRYYQCDVVQLYKETFYEVNFDDGSFSDNLFPEDIVVRRLLSTRALT